MKKTLPLELDTTSASIVAYFGTTLHYGYEGSNDEVQPHPGAFNVSEEVLASPQKHTADHGPCMGDVA